MMKKRVGVALGYWVLLLGLVGAGVWLYSVNVNFQALTRRVFLRDWQFDSAKWREGSPKARARMVWDLQNRHSPMYHTRQQMLELLGEPDARTRDDTHWYYALDDSDRPSRPQWHTFHIRFADERNPRNLGKVHLFGVQSGMGPTRSVGGLYIIEGPVEQPEGVEFGQSPPEERP